LQRTFAVDPLVAMAASDEVLVTKHPTRDASDVAVAFRPVATIVSEVGLITVDDSACEIGNDIYGVGEVLPVKAVSTNDTDLI